MEISYQELFKKKWVDSFMDIEQDQEIINLTFNAEIETFKNGQLSMENIEKKKNIRLFSKNQPIYDNSSISVSNFLKEMNLENQILIIEGQCGFGKSTLLKTFEKQTQQTYSNNMNSQIFPIYIQISKDQDFQNFSSIFTQTGLSLTANQQDQLQLDLNKGKIQFLLLVDDFHNIINQEENQLLRKICCLLNKPKIILTVNSDFIAEPLYISWRSNQQNMMKLKLKALEDYDIQTYIYEVNLKQLRCKIKNDLISDNQVNGELIWKTLSCQLDEIKQLKNQDYDLTHPIQLAKNILKENKDLKLVELIVENWIVERRQSNKYSDCLKKDTIYEFAQIPLFIEQIAIAFLKQKKLPKNDSMNLFEVFKDLLIYLISFVAKTQNKQVIIQYIKQLQNIALSHYQNKKIIEEVEDDITQKLKSFIMKYSNLKNLLLALYFDECLNELFLLLDQDFTTKKIEQLEKIHKETPLNQFDFSDEEFEDVVLYLKYPYQNDIKLRDKLLKVVKASAFIKGFEQIAGNALTILNSLNTVFRGENFSKIRIENSRIDLTHFYQCDFQQSIFKNVDISKTILDFCNLDEVCWNNIQCFSDLLFKEHPQGANIQMIKFSSNGKMLASAGNDQVYLWHIRSAKLIKKFNKEKRTIVLIALSQDNQIIAQADDYNELKLMRMKQGGIIRKFRKHISQGDNLLFSPDGSFLALQKIFDEIIVWNLQMGKQNRLQRDGSTQIQFSNDSKFIFAGYRNGVILCWSLQDLTEIDEVKTSLNCVDQLVFSPRRQILVAFGRNGLSFIDTQIFSEIQFYNTSNINLVSFLQNGKTLVFRQDQQDSIIRIIEDNEDLQKTRFQYTWQIAISPCANLLARVWKNKIELLSLKKAKKKINNTQKVDGVESVSISPDGQQFTFTHSDNIYVWNIKDKSYTNCIGVKQKFYPDGQFIFVEEDGTIFIGSSEEFTELTNMDCKIVDLQISPDGHMLAFLGDYQEITLYNITANKIIKYFKGSDDSKIAFSANSQILAYEDFSFNIILWSIKNNKIHLKLTGHREKIQFIAFSFDSSTLFSCEWKNPNQIWVWNLENGQKKCFLQGHSSWISIIAFSLDGQIFATTYQDSMIKLWSYKNLEQIQILKGHLSQIISIEFSFDGYFLISGSWDKSIRFWSVLKDQQIYVLNSEIVEFNQIQQSYLDELFNQKLDFQSQMIILAQSYEKQIFASTYQNNRIQIWDQKLKQQIHELQGHQGSILALAISHSGILLAAGGNEKIVFLWNLEKQLLLFQLKGHENTIRSVAFSLNDSILASAGQDFMIKLWNLKTQQLIKSLNEHLDWIYQIAFSPSGKLFASCSKDKTVKIWKTDFKKPSEVIHSGHCDVTAIAFSIDGKSIAIGYQDKSLYIQNLSPKTINFQLIGHRDQINSLSFSYDGNLLASGGNDSQVRIWRANDGTLVRCIFNQKVPVTSVLFLQDNLSIMYGMSDGKIKIENIYPDYTLPFVPYLLFCTSQLSIWNCSTNHSEINTEEGLDLARIYA